MSSTSSLSLSRSLIAGPVALITSSASASFGAFYGAVRVRYRVLSLLDQYMQYKHECKFAIARIPGMRMRNRIFRVYVRRDHWVELN